MQADTDDRSCGRDFIITTYIHTVDDFIYKETVFDDYLVLPS